MIYYNAIERDINRSIKSDMNFYAKISYVLAHEYFHAMAPGHMLWNNSSYQEIKGYQKKELREALADCFSVLWCYEQGKSNNGFTFMDVARSYELLKN